MSDSKEVEVVVTGTQPDVTDNSEYEEVEVTDNGTDDEVDDAKVVHENDLSTNNAVNVSTGNVNVETGDNITGDQNNNQENTQVQETKIDVKNNVEVKPEVKVVVNVELAPPPKSREEQLRECGVDEKDPHYHLYRCPAGMNPKIKIRHVVMIIRAIYNVLSGKPLTAKMVIHVVYAVWSTTKRMDDLTGGLKKEVMMWGIRAIVDDQDNLDEEDKKLLMLMIDDALDGMIDTVAAAKKEGYKVPCWLRCCFGGGN